MERAGALPHSTRPDLGMSGHASAWPSSPTPTGSLKTHQTHSAMGHQGSGKTRATACKADLGFATYIFRVQKAAKQNNMPQASPKEASAGGKSGRERWLRQEGGKKRLYTSDLRKTLGTPLLLPWSMGLDHTFILLIRNQNYYGNFTVSFSLLDFQTLGV